MSEILNSLLYASAFGFAMTYLLHSTVWVVIVLLIIKLPLFNTPLLKNYLCKAALVGSLLTSIFVFFCGNTFFNIPITQAKSEHIDATLNYDNGKMVVGATDVVSPIQLPATYEQISPMPTPLVETKKINWSAYMPFVFIFWLIGSVFFLLKMIGDHWIYFRKTDPRLVIQNTNILAVFHAIQQKVKLTKPIKLTQSNNLQSPILIRNQEICLPEKAILKMDNEQLEAMLAHELAHIVRKDYYWAFAFAILEIVFFFQPLHRLIKRELNESNEILCDAWAAEVTGNNLAVAQCLLTVATWIKGQPNEYTLVAGMSLKKSELSNRIQSLIQFPNKNNSELNLVKSALFFSIIMTTILFVLPAFSFTTIKTSTFLTPKIEREAIPISTTEHTKEAKIIEVKNNVRKTIKTTKAEELAARYNLTLKEFKELSSEKRKCIYLLDAVKTNDIVKTRKLLATITPDCMFCGSNTPSTPINIAARNGNVEMMRLLLDLGADIYHQSYKDEGALIATAKNGNVTIMKLLYDNGAYFDHEFKGYGTVLTTAIHHNNFKMVSYLLSKNADPMKPLENGKTAMDYAQEKGGKMWDLVSNFK